MKRTTSLAIGTIAFLAYQLYKAHPEWQPGHATPSKGRRKGKSRAKAR